MEDEKALDQDAREFVAAQLIEVVKRTQSSHADFEMPIVDETCVWLVSVKRMGIASE